MSAHPVLKGATVLLALLASPPAMAETPTDDPFVTRDAWKERVSKAKARAEQMRRERRSFIATPPSEAELEERRMRDALTDPGLRPGDVIATRRGLLQFRGSPDGERRPQDFVPVEQ